jgi:hypothetical protein
MNHDQAQRDAWTAEVIAGDEPVASRDARVLRRGAYLTASARSTSARACRRMPPTAGVPR